MIGSTMLSVMRRGIRQPIAQKWTGPYGGCLLLIYNISQIKPAFDVAIKDVKRDWGDCQQSEGAHFENTIAQMERAGSDFASWRYTGFILRT
jgi:hypothetical protein